MEEFLPKPTNELFQRSRHKKFLSETISTNCCTVDIERPSQRMSVSKILDNHSELMTGKKLSKKRIFELPERLHLLKQITENKIKFLKLEQDNKELEKCTFKPKTNLKAGKTSLTEFLKHQTEYTKSKNSAGIRQKFQNVGHISHRNLKPYKVSEVPVFDRLYKDSKVLTRSMKRIN